MNLLMYRLGFGAAIVHQVSQNVKELTNLFMYRLRFGAAIAIVHQVSMILKLLNLMKPQKFKGEQVSPGHIVKHYSTILQT